MNITIRQIMATMLDPNKRVKIIESAKHDNLWRVKITFQNNPHPLLMPWSYNSEESAEMDSRQMSQYVAIHGDKSFLTSLFNQWALAEFK